MATVRNEKRIPAAAGDQVYASAMIRGKGKCHIRICWYDKDGKMLKKYFITGKYADKDWKKFEVTEKVPSGAESFVISCEAINVPAEVEFDAIDCNIVKAETIANAEAEFPANGSFEVPSDKISNRNWRHYPAKGWEGYAHPDVKSYCKVIRIFTAKNDIFYVITVKSVKINVKQPACFARIIFSADGINKHHNSAIVVASYNVINGLIVRN